MNNYLMLHEDKTNHTVIINLDEVVSIGDMGDKTAKISYIDKNSEIVNESSGKIWDILSKEELSDMFIKLHKYPDNDIILLNKKYIERVFKYRYNDYKDIYTTKIVCKHLYGFAYESVESIYSMLRPKKDKA